MVSRVPIVLGADGGRQQSQAGEGLILGLVDPPVAPAAGAVALGMQSLGGYEFPAFQNAHGAARVMQPHIGRSGAYGTIQFLYNNAAAQYGGSFATGGFTPMGTAAANAFATTNYLTCQPRVSYNSSATAGNFTGVYSNAAQNQFLTIGSSGLGGGWADIRFAIGDTVAAPLMFVGISSATAAPSATADPATLTNCIGVGVSQTVANPGHLYLFFGGSTAQTPIDLFALNSAFSASATSTLFELIIFSDPITGLTGWTVNAFTNSVIPTATVSGTITNTTPGTTLPASSAQMGLRYYRSNNATAAAVTLTISSAYLTGNA